MRQVKGLYTSPTTCRRLHTSLFSITASEKYPLNCVSSQQFSYFLRIMSLKSLVAVHISFKIWKTALTLSSFYHSLNTADLTVRFFWSLMWFCPFLK